ncbi:MAG: alpha/beta fold hydrolase, partial [Burkholderiales bacterium]
TLESYIGWMRSKEGRDWFVQFFRHYELRPRPEFDAGLEKLTQPTAVIWGERDPFCSASIARDLAARIPGASLTLIPDAGHFVMEQSPERVLTALRQWLDRAR